MAHTLKREQEVSGKALTAGSRTKGAADEHTGG